MTATPAPSDLLALSPCPFCGGAATFVGKGGPYSGHAVLCTAGKGCTASLGEHYDRDGEDDHYFSTAAEAIAAWNARPSLSAQAVGNGLPIAWIDPNDAIFTAPPWRMSTPILYGSRDLPHLIPIFTSPQGGEEGLLRDSLNQLAAALACEPELEAMLHQIDSLNGDTQPRASGIPVSGSTCVNTPQPSPIRQDNPAVPTSAPKPGTTPPQPADGGELAHMKVIVPDYVNADDANRLYGDGYGVDWEYEGSFEASADGGDPLSAMFPSLQSDLSKLTTGARLMESFEDQDWNSVRESLEGRVLDAATALMAHTEAAGMTLDKDGISIRIEPIAYTGELS